MKLPSILYHGTSTGYLNQILRDGLDPISSHKGYLCYTPDLAIAKHHADAMAEWDPEYVKRPCSPIIFAIPIDRFLPSAFCLDENFITLNPSAGRAAGKPMQHLVGSWRQVLALAGSVGNKRLVRVSRDMIVSRNPGLPADHGSPRVRTTLKPAAPEPDEPVAPPSP
jgi:hypothetical protein